VKYKNQTQKQTTNFAAVATDDVSLGVIGRDDQEPESDDHELEDDGNLCVLGIVITV
jgi:hypothetical protein